MVCIRQGMITRFKVYHSFKMSWYENTVTVCNISYTLKIVINKSVNKNSRYDVLQCNHSVDCLQNDTHFMSTVVNCWQTGFPEMFAERLLVQYKSLRLLCSALQSSTHLLQPLSFSAWVSVTVHSNQDCLWHLSHHWLSTGRTVSNAPVPPDSVVLHRILPILKKESHHSSFIFSLHAVFFSHYPHTHSVFIF